MLTLQTYIWRSISRRVGQLAGIKLDPQVPRCSVGLKAILKASPTVLHQWESMDSGQAKQPGASRTPGGLHLFSVYTLASFMFKHDMSSHVPVCQRYQATRAWTQHHGMLHISHKNQTNNYLTVCIRALCGVYLCAMGECAFMHAKGHRLRIYGSAYRRWKHRAPRVQTRRYPPFLHNLCPALFNLLKR